MRSASRAARSDAHLVLAGGSADDDPEGAEVLKEVQERAGGRNDISILSLPPDAHLTINALQHRSTVVVQKSLREGFALTVSEALWKRRAVVASAVGGIPLQVIDGHTGLLTRSVEGCAYQITRALRSPALRRRLGSEGREHVRDNFLHPREARDYLAVFAWLLRPGDAVVRRRRAGERQRGEERPLQAGTRRTCKRRGDEERPLQAGELLTLGLQRPLLVSPAPTNQATSLLVSPPPTIRQPSQIAIVEVVLGRFGHR
jgi:hypothetical protein